MCDLSIYVSTVCICLSVCLHFVQFLTLYFSKTLTSPLVLSSAHLASPSPHHIISLRRMTSGPSSALWLRITASCPAEMCPLGERADGSAV